MMRLLKKRYNIPYLYIATAIVLFGFLAPVCAADLIWAPPGLTPLIDEGLANNHSLQSMASMVEASKVQIPAAGALPDPKVGITALNLPTDTFDFNQEPMTQKQIAVEQNIPWLSKLTLKSEAVAQDARQQTADLKAARLKLARDLADAYYELGFVAESQRINKRLIEMVQRIRRDAESRYAVGKGLQQNIFQAEVELSRLQDEAIMLRNKRQILQDRLHSLLNRQQYRPIDPPQNLPNPDFNVDRARLTDAALSANPDLESLQAVSDRSEAETELAQKEYYPDFNLRVAYGQRDEDLTGRNLPDFFSVGVMIDVPLWYRTKQSNEVAAARYELRSAENRYDDLKRRLPHQINALASEIEDTRKRFRLFMDQLIPQAQQWARSALDAYEVGKVEFDTMIDARIRLLRYEREASRLLYTVYQKRAELEALIGQPLNAEQGGKTDIHHGAREEQEVSLK